MVLIYVTNDRLGEVADIAKALKEEHGNVDYRNPRLFDKPNRCQGVYIDGDFPEIAKAYGDKIISIQSEKDSTDYTIAELRDIKPELTDEEWSEFTSNDTRKSIDSI